MEITVNRIEIELVTNKPKLLETSVFDDWLPAFAYLEKHLNMELSDDHKQAFKNNPFTSTNPQMEMVSSGNVVYSARVCYEVEVKK